MRGKSIIPVTTDDLCSIANLDGSGSSITLDLPQTAPAPSTKAMTVDQTNGKLYFLRTTDETYYSGHAAREALGSLCARFLCRHPTCRINLYTGPVAPLAISPLTPWLKSCIGVR